METDLDGVTWLTRKEAAAHCRVKSERTIDRWAEEGKITRYRAEGLQSVRFKRSELDALFVPEDGRTDRERMEDENEEGVAAELFGGAADPFAD